MLHVYHVYIHTRTIEIIIFPPGQNGRHFVDDIFKRIFLNEKFRISIQISLKFVPMSPIDNKPALVQIMAWHRTGDKPLPEPMMALFIDAYAALGGDELKTKCAGLSNTMLYKMYQSTTYE